MTVSFRSTISRMALLLAITGTTVALLTVAAQAAPATYYVDIVAGRDSADGAAPERAWATLARASTADLGPGDRLLLRGGQRHPGTLTLTEQDAGTPAAPVRVGSYGGGRAVVIAGTGSAVIVYNAAGIAVTDLDLVGTGPATNTGSGISFYTDLAGDRRLPYVRVQRLSARGFGASGVSVGGWNGLTGFSDVIVADVSAVGNGRAGISTFGQRKGANTGVQVIRSRAQGTTGIAGLTVPSGSGIVLGGVDGGRIERCVATGNGAANTHHAGPVGIWAYDANMVVIEHNESYANRTRGGDGGGFDLDGGVTNSVLQYNYSHDNDGPGFLLAQYAGAPAFGGNVVRYNVSEHDARRGSYGAIHLWNGGSGLRDVRIEHNTVVVGPSSTGYPRAISLGTSTANVQVRNNIFQTTGGLRTAVWASSGQSAVVFSGNDYAATGTRPLFTWAGSTSDGLDAWRAASGQERGTGLSVDPGLVAPGAGGTIGDPGRLELLGAYRLRADSALVDAAIGPADGGLHDFFGTALPSDRRDIGAAEAVRLVNLVPTADALVRDGSYATTIYGASTVLKVKRSAHQGDGYTRESFITFDLTSAPSTVRRATLRLDGALSGTAEAAVSVTVHPLDPTSWNETAATWAARPTPGPALGSAAVTGTAVNSVTWDVTAYLQRERAAGRTMVALALLAPTPSTAAVVFASREAATGQPSLIVEGE